MTALPCWLEGHHALLVGQGRAIESVGTVLRAAGAAVSRSDPGAQEASSIAERFDAAEAGLGSVDILVHGGTGVAAVDPLAVDLAAWRDSHSADIDGRFLYMAEFDRRRLAAGDGGAILLLMPSATPVAGQVAAASAHGALDNLVKSLAVEWARDGVRVNAIASRIVEGGTVISDAELTTLGNLAAYLVSDYAAYVSGSTMGVDET